MFKLMLFIAIYVVVALLTMDWKPINTDTMTNDINQHYDVSWITLPVRINSLFLCFDFLVVVSFSAWKRKNAHRKFWAEVFRFICSDNKHKTNLPYVL